MFGLDNQNYTTDQYAPKLITSDLSKNKQMKKNGDSKTRTQSKSRGNSQEPRESAETPPINYPGH